MPEVSLHGCMAASCLTLLIFDYALTFPTEVSAVWPSRLLSWGPPLFYVNRYVPICTQVLMLILNVKVHTQDLCRRIYIIAMWSIIVGVNTAHTVIYLQTCAIWANKRSVVYPLLFLLLAKITVSCILNQMQLARSTYVDSYLFNPPLTGCLVLSTEFVARWTYVVVFISEALTIGVTLVKAMQHIRRSNSSWVIQLYRNGILYSLVVVVLSLANTIIPNIKSLPPQYQLILSPYASPIYFLPFVARL
ncbi:hypothetical protein CC2G_012358 [Coprinopsis cinerea AmutBmut pab1-1]|nr:hypothetical protein CC2G_012358 [Coprinopsis cinerea AmutBmut pab1-1]